MTNFGLNLSLIRTFAVGVVVSVSRIRTNLECRSSRIDCSENTHVQIKRLPESFNKITSQNPNLLVRERRGIRSHCFWLVSNISLHNPPYIGMGGQGFHHLGGRRGRWVSLMRSGPQKKLAILKLSYCLFPTMSQQTERVPTRWVQVFPFLPIHSISRGVSLKLGCPFHAQENELDLDKLIVQMKPLSSLLGPDLAWHHHKSVWDTICKDWNQD